MYRFWGKQGHSWLWSINILQIWQNLTNLFIKKVIDPQYAHQQTHGMKTSANNWQNCQLETVSTAKPLQNRQHARTPYLGQIWHAPQWDSGICLQAYTSGLVYCMAPWGRLFCHLPWTKKTQFRANFEFGCSCTQHPLLIKAKFGMLE